MTNENPREPAPGMEGRPDRRQPVARYVEFGDEEVQARFIAAAENAYQGLVGADSFEGRGQVELRGAPSPQRRRLFRSSAPDAGRTVPATPALARVAHTASAIPRELESSPKSCGSSRRVARTLASVATDLLGDLLELDPSEQAEHLAYRQTLRLAAELEGLRDLIAEVGCTDPSGCVGIRLPEHWGRRVEDVEVSEVRTVLHRLALAGEDDG